eukprot:EG_transcript_19756
MHHGRGRWGWLLPFLLLLASPTLIPTCTDAKSFRFAMALEDQLWDFGWTFRANLARIALQNQLSDKYPNVTVSHELAVIPMAATKECPPQLLAWCRAGVDVVISTMVSLVDCVKQVAAACPTTAFLTSLGSPVGPPNYANVWVRLYQPSYLAGYTAGLMTKTKKVCVSTILPIPPAFQDLFGFTHGVRNADPTVEIHVFGTGLIRAALLETWIVNQSYALGCDVMWVQSASLDGTQQAVRLGMMAIGEISDARLTLGENVLTSILIDMTSPYMRACEAAMRGTLSNDTQRPDWWMGWEWGGVNIANFSFLVPNNIRAKVMA